MSVAYYNADAAVKIVGTFDCCISSAGSTGIDMMVPAALYWCLK